METKFGKWLKTRNFKYVFLFALIILNFYSGLRFGNALEWGIGFRLYPHAFFLFLFMFFLLFSLMAGNGNALLRCLKRTAAYFLCCLLYDVLALLVVDLLALIFCFQPKIKAWFIVIATLVSILLLIYGNVHARKIKDVFYTVHWGSQKRKKNCVIKRSPYWTFHWCSVPATRSRTCKLAEP